MTQPLRKIVIVNTADDGGGAECVSMAVLNGFLQLGIDAWLLVGNKTRNHARVVSFYTSAFFDYRPYLDPSLTEEIEERRRVDRSLGLEDFNHPYSHLIDQLTGTPPDLVLCHNLHGGYFDLRALIGLSARMPVALRLFDTWLLAGHCAYSLGCERWRIGCGECPDLTIPPAIAADGTHANFVLKQQIFQNAQLFVSAESQWMLDRARQSVLAPAAIDLKHISGGVNLSIFHPGPRDAARRQLGLDPDTTLLLYVANDGAANRYKDFATVRRALQALAGRSPAGRIVLLVVGDGAAEEVISPNIAIRHVGRVRSRSWLAAYYRAADVMLHAAVEETFCNVVAEAMACGTPVISASGGGVVELIEQGRTGMVVAPRQPAQLADAIQRLLDRPALRAEMGEAAAAWAETHLDSRVMIRSLLSWCTESHAAWHARAALHARAELHARAGT